MSKDESLISLFCERWRRADAQEGFLQLPQPRIILKDAFPCWQEEDGTVTPGTQWNGACLSCFPWAGIMLSGRYGVKQPGRAEEEKSMAWWRGGRVRDRHVGRRRWGNGGLYLEKQHDMAAEQRGWEAKKEVRSTDSASGLHLCSGILIHTCLQPTAETMTKSTAKCKPSKRHQPQADTRITPVVLLGVWLMWCLHMCTSLKAVNVEAYTRSLNAMKVICPLLRVFFGDEVDLTFLITLAWLYWEWRALSLSEDAGLSHCI